MTPCVHEERHGLYGYGAANKVDAEIGSAGRQGCGLELVSGEKRKRQQ